MSNDDKERSSARRPLDQSGNLRNNRVRSGTYSGASPRPFPSSSSFWNVVMHPQDKAVDTPLRQSQSSNPISRGTGSRAKRSSRSGSTKQFPCKHCTSIFERRGHLEAHVETVHEGKRPHHCPHGCGKVFGHRSSLSRHIKSAHENAQNPSSPQPSRGHSQQKGK